MGYKEISLNLAKKPFFAKKAFVHEAQNLNLIRYIENGFHWQENYSFRFFFLGVIICSNSPQISLQARQFDHSNLIF